MPSFSFHIWFLDSDKQCGNDTRPISEHTSEEVSLIIDTNLLSAHNLSQLAYPLLKASGAGSVVFLSSIVGLIPVREAPIYGLTKSNLISRQMYTYYYTRFISKLSDK